MAVTTCTVCQSSSVRLEAAFDEVRLFRCSACDHCFTDMSAIANKECYGPEYFLKIHKNWFANPDFGQFKLLRDRILAISKEARVFDVGCGTGNLLRFLAQKSPTLQLTGIDLIENDPYPGIEFIRGDFLIANSGRQYDFVSTLHTIEHIEDLPTFMEGLKAVCRPGGFIAITTINERSLLYRAARLLRMLGKPFAFERIYSIHHTNHFNFSSLPRLCRLSGLEVVEVIGSNIRLESVDIPARSVVGELVLKLGVRLLFWLGSLSGATYQQTVICRRV